MIESRRFKTTDGRTYVGTPDQLSPTALVRNHDTVHRRWCWRVTNIRVTAWWWAEGKTRAEVAVAAENGLKFCGSCKPLEHLADTDEGNGDE